MRSALALALPACGGGSSQGALGQASASAACPSTDLSCLVRGLDGPLAVGATAKINLSIQFQGAAAPPSRLVSSHPGILAVDASTVRGASPGHATLLIMLAGEDAVIDFLHVWVAAPDGLALGLVSGEGQDLGDAPTGIQLLPGDDLFLTPRLLAQGQPLLGAAQVTWTADSDVVTLLRQATPDRMRVVARRPGLATVTVALGGLGASMQLEVLP